MLQKEETLTTNNIKTIITKMSYRNTDFQREVDRRCAEQAEERRTQKENAYNKFVEEEARWSEYERARRCEYEVSCLVYERAKQKKECDEVYETIWADLHAIRVEYETNRRLQFEEVYNLIWTNLQKAEKAWYKNAREQKETDDLLSVYDGIYETELDDDVLEHAVDENSIEVLAKRLGIKLY